MLHVDANVFSATIIIRRYFYIYCASSMNGLFFEKTYNCTWAYCTDQAILKNFIEQ